MQQGLKNNRKQFWLLVLINAFVGSMVGLERSVLSGFGESVFHLNGKTALLSFIIAFAENITSSVMYEIHPFIKEKF